MGFSVLCSNDEPYACLLDGSVSSNLETLPETVLVADVRRWQPRELEL